MQRNRLHQKGQALLEGSLILFLFLVFFIGTIDFGQFLYFHQSLTERARAAVRYGAVNPADRTGIQNVAVYNDPAGTVNGAAALVPNFTTDMVTVCLPGDGSCSDSSTGPDWRVTVTISGYQMTTFNLFMPKAFSNQPITASLPSEVPFS